LSSIQVWTLAAIRQLTTAGGLSSTLSTRFSKTGAGVPHWPLRMGFESSTTAPVGASNRTHSSKAEMISASLHAAAASAAGAGATGGWSTGTGVFALADFDSAGAAA